MTKTKLEWALEIAERGLPVFPLHHTLPNGDCSCSEGAACKSKGKHPIYKGGYEDATVDSNQIEKWWKAKPDANIAIHPGDKFAYIDLDVTKGRNGPASLAQYLGTTIEALPKLTYTVQTPSGGWHLYFSVDAAQSNRAGVLKGVDVRGQGGHVVAPGSTIYRQNEFEEWEELPYKVINDVPVVPVPVGISGLLREQREKSEKANVSAIEGAQDHPEAVGRMRELLRYRKPAVEGEGGNQHTYVTAVQCRDHDISEAMTFELMTEEGGWNERCEPPWEHDELKGVIKNAYNYAKSQPGNKGGALMDLFDDDEASILPDDFYDIGGPKTPEEKKSANRFEKYFHNSEKFLALPDDYSFVVDGWVPDRGYTAVNGKRSSGKTTLVMDMVCHAACDLEWHNTSTDMGWTIVYIAAEDDIGVKSRFKAWCMKKFGKEELPDPDRIMWLTIGIDLMNDTEVQTFISFVRKKTKKLNKVLFVLDTWQRVTSHAEGQSDEKDMQHAIRNLEYMSREFRGPSLILTHPPDGKADKISGSMVIENHSQAIIKVEDAVAGVRDVVVKRIKGAPEGTFKKVRIIPQAIHGYDKWGRKLTGALIEYVAGSIDHTLKAPIAHTELKQAQIFADIVKRMSMYDPTFSKKGRDYITLSDVAKVVYEIYAEQEPTDPIPLLWRKELMASGLTEPEVRGLNGSEFRPARSPVLKIINGLMERFPTTGVNIQKDNLWLVTKVKSGRTTELIVEHREGLMEQEAGEQDDSVAKAEALAEQEALDAEIKDL